MPVHKKVQRQVQIMMLLSDAPMGMTLSALDLSLRRRGSDVTAKTLRRDMTDLLEVFQIRVEGTTNEPLYSMGSFSMDGFRFRFEDMQAFQLLKELAIPYSHLDIGQRMSSFLLRLEESLPNKQKSWLEKAAKMMTVKPSNFQEERDIPYNVRVAVEDGISKLRRVHIRYKAFSNNTITERTVEPLKIEFYEGCHHLWAFCCEKNQIRDFRLSRIVDAKLLGEQFQPKYDLLEKAMKNRFDNLSSQDSVKIILKFKGFGARFVQEYFQNRSDQMEQQKDGSLLFVRTAGLTDDLVRWILGFGSDVEVIEPKVLREQIVKTIQNMIGRYMG